MKERKNGKTGGTGAGYRRVLLTCLYMVLAFSLTFATGFILFILKKIVPFGEQSVLAMDLWGQYMPMYIQQVGVTSFQAMQHSWNGALGYNNWAQNAYYTNSIFLQALRFVPTEKLVEAVGWMCLTKISLSAASCFFYLDRTIGKRRFFLVSGAVAYSLSAYTLAFLSQPMWLDAVILAPLILLAIDRLAVSGKGGAYSVLLALAIISNFYVGFGLCIFCVLYFLFHVPSLRIRQKTEGLLPAVSGFWRFAVYSLLAGALSGAVIIPTIAAISRTIAIEQGAPTSVSWYAGIKAYLEMLLPGQGLKLEFTGVNIFSGILVFIALPLYFANRRYNWKERLLDGILLLLLFLSMNCNILDYLWHGLHFPNQLPGRWTYLFSLFVVYLVCKGIAAAEKASVAALYISAGAGVSLWAAALIGAEDQPSLLYSGLFALALLTVIGCAAAVYGSRLREAAEKKRREAGTAAANARETAAANAAVNAAADTAGNAAEGSAEVRNPLVTWAIVLLALLQIAGSVMNYLDVARREKAGLRTAVEPSYTKAVSKAKSLGDRYRSGGDDFYRIEAYSGTTFNPSMLGDFRGISYYSSTMDGGIYRLLAFLGNRVYAKNVSSVYNLASPVQNGIFGVRYFFDFNGGLPSNTANELVYTASLNEGDVYQNPTALPVAFAVDDAALQFTVTDEVRAIANQEAFLEALTGAAQDVFTPIAEEAFSHTNCRLSESADWDTNYYYRDNANEPVSFTWEYVCETEGPVLLENNFRAGTLTMRFGTDVRTAVASQTKMIYLGRLSKGTRVEVSLQAENVSVGCFGVNLYSFDQEKWEKAYRLLAEGGLKVTDASDCRIRGTIELENEALVMSTLPRDGGWTVYCDGKELKTEAVADILLAFTVPEGSHELEFRYHVPGLGAGIAVSAAALAALLAMLLVSAKPEVLKKLRLPGRLNRKGTCQK